MQSVLGLAVVLSAVILLSLVGVVLPASDGWPPPAADPAAPAGLEDPATAVELTGEGHSPTVDDEGHQTGLLRRRRRRRQKHHHRQQHDSKVRDNTCVRFMGASR